MSGRVDNAARKDYYGAGRQPWDDIVDFGLGPSFAACNVLKYVRRASMKNGADDVEKARWYNDRLREFQEAGSADAVRLAMWLSSLLSEEELRLLS